MDDVSKLDPSNSDQVSGQQNRQETNRHSLQRRRLLALANGAAYNAGTLTGDLLLAAQMILLHELFSHNMAAINFWLASCVVPDATRVYEGRVGTSAWHLAEQPKRLHSWILG